MDISQVLKAVCPWLATALTGPLGGLAVSTLCDTLGVPDKTADGLKKALAGVTPADMLALKQADQAFAVQMQQLGYKTLEDLEAIAAGDRKDARDMQKQTHSIVPAVLSISVTIGYFSILVGMMMGWLHVTDSQALLLMLGSLTTGWGVVMAFWFGTTRDSQEKTQLLAKAQPIPQ